MNDSRPKVVAFNGSARKGGNTAILLRCVLKELQSEGIETELVELAGTQDPWLFIVPKVLDSEGPALLAEGRHRQRLY